MRLRASSCMSEQLCIFSFLNLSSEECLSKILGSGVETSERLYHSEPIDRFPLLGRRWGGSENAAISMVERRREHHEAVFANEGGRLCYQCTGKGLRAARYKNGCCIFVIRRMDF